MKFPASGAKATAGIATRRNGFWSITRNGRRRIRLKRFNRSKPRERRSQIVSRGGEKRCCSNRRLDASRLPDDSRTARSVWTACGSPPLSLRGGIVKADALDIFRRDERAGEPGDVDSGEFHVG